MIRNPTESENERLIRQLLDGVWTNRDVGVIQELVVEVVTVTNAAFGVELHGIDQFRETMERALDAFSDIG